MGSAYSAEELANKTNEWLLELRGAGSKINTDTHSRIESEMIRRGLRVPSLPEHPLRVTGYSRTKEALFILGSMLFVTTCFFVLYRKIGLLALLICFFLQVGAFLRLSYLKLPPNLLPDEARRSLRRGLKNGVTELMITASLGDVKRLNDLINYGAPINAVTKSGLTALMYAAANNQVDAYKFLISNGADESIKSGRGLTARQIAEEKGFGSMFY